MLLCSFASISYANQTIHQHTKPVISDSALFFINEDIKIHARIDSGATRTSVNAHNIAVKNEHKQMKMNIGKTITFYIVDSHEKASSIQSKILDVKTVKTPQGREHRYLVDLYLSWNGKKIK